MSAFLLLLVKVNLAMAAAVVLVSLLRRPLRAQFGAPIAYAIWFLVPVAGMASLLPPRVIAAPVIVTQVPVAPVSVIGHIAYSALSVTDRLTGQSALVLAVPPASAHAMPELLLFAVWVLGAGFMVLYLARLQLRFHAAARAGRAGPAVLGFITPRIVTPDGFQDRFTVQEQAAILAHEHVHLARQDARINTLAALLRCLCWFNPLIHLGARWLRIDQELACDAAVVAGAIPRRDYAKALLKSQIVVTTLPLGCNWPGAQHPLIERIDLLKRKPPGAARRLAGASLVLLAATLAGLSAWAAQPPVAAKATAARRPAMTLAALPVAAPDQTAQEPVADANPASSSDADASENADPDGAVSATPAPPRTVSIEARPQFVPTALPQIASIAEPPKIADQASQDVSLEPKEVLAKNTEAAPATGDVTASGAAAEPVVVPDTPDGGGDPDTIVCRAPQRIAGTDKFGDVACGHNYEWQKLALNGKDLAADDKTLIPRATVANPAGEGDPNGVTCRTTGFFSPNPPLCRINRFWANLIKNHQAVYDDGVLATQRASNDFGSIYGGSNSVDSGSWQSGGMIGGMEHTGGH